MKIAVPTRDNEVDEHFGHCDTYTIFEIDGGRIVLSKEVLRWSQGCGCKSNIVGTLKEMGVTTLLAGNMGQGALNVLLTHEINVVRGCDGSIDNIIDQYLAGMLSDQEILCQSHHNCH